MSCEVEVLGIHSLTNVCVFLPLIGGLLAGLCGRFLRSRMACLITILALSLALICAAFICMQVFNQNISTHWTLYTWLSSGSFNFHFGFWVDKLTAVMMVTVIFVSLLVHIFSVGYMAEDAGIKRFFSYMSVFTFFMLALTTADNFMQLFFGWEGVGLMSYLLIGFWYTKADAAEGSLKAFLVNRVGDLGLLLGLAAILEYFGSLDYSVMFANLHSFSGTLAHAWPFSHAHLLTLIAILLFIGAMGKSAQIPLHVWLPESMAGPTPISALIHAATMVTAGVFMVARLSPLYEYSNAALSLILIVGSTGALFLGLLALVENDIKRVVAYSTMSQLGYMMAANGASAYGFAIFHLMTHACFKALLFLACGAVILACHHVQDMRQMGGLRRKLPVTYITFLIGGLALSAMPFFSGFYSKELVIESVHGSTLFGAHYAYDCLVVGAFVTAFYTFRLFFRVFHGNVSELSADAKPPAAVVRWPLIILAVPSLLLGMWLYARVVGGVNWLGKSITIHATHALAEVPKTASALVSHSLRSPALWASISGIILAAVFYLWMPRLPEFFKQRFKVINKILHEQYGFDRFNNFFFVRGSQKLSQWFFHSIDEQAIDHRGVMGTGRFINRLSRFLKRIQTGYLYHYVFVMMLSLMILIFWLLFGR